MNELSELALELSDAVECIFEEAATDYSLQELVDTALSEADLLPIESRAIHWILANREIEAGLRLSRLSYSSLTAPDLVEDKGLDQEPLDVMVPAGITALLHRLAEGTLILTERRVTTVEQLHDAVRVGCHSGEQYSAPHAVVTTPPGVLKSNTIRFHPPLPACHAEALEGIDVGERIQVTLDFANVFWPKSPHFLGYLAQEEDAFAQFVNHYPITGQIRLTALAGDTSARRLSSASHEQLVSVAMATLRRMLVAANIEAPTHSTSSRWLNEPGSLGATAGLISGSSPATRTAFSQPHGRVWLAGDATHVGKPNSLEGAAASGLEVARKIISLTQRNHDSP
jgi:monoamine oxidase